ncbi:DUF6843 domain-containing protein [Corallococcus exiguus]|uniref:DUF6843 domain-containing protein n=1 Tax=Corallococcus exiguus TaxID=83462 RepID=A0A7X5BRP0_9BACT|nr:hypothetical protein [Corallococcus exiguus]NBC38432.1 hypothetical protein [Corallococcus exiguus]TNV63786.1 hypothetical protein FH620_14240 [Corallococcus exiguus]
MSPSRKRLHLCLLPALLGLLACGTRAAPEVHLIPQGYRGPVVIFFNVPGARSALQEDGREYRIGEDGTLAVSSPPNYGGGRLDNFRFFYEGPGGTRERLAYAASTPHNQLQVFAVHQGEMPLRPGSREEVRFEMYVVGVPDEMPDWSDRLHALVERKVAAMPLPR